ncbi:MAG TPA: hypothetical protein P5571_12375 [Candidatus Krumholzibacteria bacterium]|nr:hypothetical protein [Candidatus Krumholzibacteria bacterium]HRX52156.1 hypothetical protein [Candidatus Krumholzibacteria bacterium]
MRALLVCILVVCLVRSASGQVLGGDNALFVVKGKPSRELNIQLDGKEIHANSQQLYTEGHLYRPSARVFRSLCARPYVKTLIAAGEDSVNAITRYRDICDAVFAALDGQVFHDRGELHSLLGAASSDVEQVVDLDETVRRAAVGDKGFAVITQGLPCWLDNGIERVGRTRGKARADGVSARSEELHGRLEEVRTYVESGRSVLVVIGDGGINSIYFGDAAEGARREYCAFVSGADTGGKLVGYWDKKYAVKYHDEWRGICDD